MAEALRDDDKPIECVFDKHGASIPIGAMPMRNYWEDSRDHDYVFRKYYLGDKFKYGKDLNGTERNRLSSICNLEERQLIQCYGPWDDGHGFSVAELKSYCAKCPYAFHEDDIGFKTFQIKAYEAQDSIWYPHFVQRYIKEHNMECHHDNPKTFVYFVTDGKYVKIGKGSESNDRISQLQTGNPRKITTMFRIYLNNQNDAYALERHLHWRYRDYKTYGEWFDIYERLNIPALEDNIILFDWKWKQKHERGTEQADS